MFDFKVIVQEVKDKIILSDKKCLSYKRAYEAFGGNENQDKWIEEAKKYFGNHQLFKSGRGKGGTIVLRNEIQPTISDNITIIIPDVLNKKIEISDQETENPAASSDEEDTAIDDNADEKSFSKERRFFPKEVEEKTAEIQNTLQFACAKRMGGEFLRRGNGINDVQDKISIFIERYEYTVTNTSIAVITEIIRAFSINKFSSENKQEYIEITTSFKETFYVSILGIEYLKNLLTFFGGASYNQGYSWETHCKQ